MNSPTANPWATGPAEILDHVTSLLKRDSDTNRRLAMILTDLAVEQMIKTYLSLPRRVTGIQIPRRKRDEIFESFPALLDALEEYGASRLAGIDLAYIDWYHRLRNELYHQGFGLTIERNKVEIYTELAHLLFRNLFGFSLPESTAQDADPLGDFLELYNRLETALAALSSAQPTTANRLSNLNRLRAIGVLSGEQVQAVDRFRLIRNQVVHGVTDYKTVITPDELKNLKQIVGSVEGQLKE